MSDLAPDTTTIIVVEEDSRLREAISSALDGSDVHLIRVRSEVEAQNCLQAEPADVLVAPMRSPSADGAHLLSVARSIHERIAVILIVDPNTLDTDSAVRLMQNGAYDFVERPVNLERLRAIVQRARREQAVYEENRALHEQLSSETSLVGFTGKSPIMRAIYDRIIRLAGVPNTTVLILGESGTGKELAARAIHFHSARRKGPMVSFNCAAVPESLAETELFGHEEGAFTGATRRRKGRFETAHGGTLLLDEVGEMDLGTQAKLLRVLETREFERIGGEKSVHVDVRIIASTNRDLLEAVRAGSFREDLYHRLCVATLQMPPLRERVEDIPILAHAFLRQFATAADKPIRGFTARTLRLLERCPWSGNVRELKNAVEAMVVSAEGDMLDLPDLPDWLVASGRQAESSDDPDAHRGEPRDAGQVISTESDADRNDPKRAHVFVGMTMREIEREAIRATLHATNGNRAEAARILDIGRRTLFRKIKELAL
ncbi:sigma-54-dependent Fis family transcriptional regulator [Candidatus Poribacteria bacterium]|nr:sigma-54-dependent Fis family transcriptional regulator [Candidatus Poribacteria bacterium]